MMCELFLAQYLTCSKHPNVFGEKRGIWRAADWKEVAGKFEAPCGQARSPVTSVLVHPGLPASPWGLSPLGFVPQVARMEVSVRARLVSQPQGVHHREQKCSTFFGSEFF